LTTVAEISDIFHAHYTTKDSEINSYAKAYCHKFSSEELFHFAAYKEIEGTILTVATRRRKLGIIDL